MDWDWYWERYVAHKKVTVSALEAARWDHLNGILQTSLEEKNTKRDTSKPF